MKIARISALVLGLAVSFSVAFAAPEMSKSQLAQRDRMYHTFLAPCCWRETVAVHRSPESLETREQIDSLIRAGKSDEELIAHFVSLHGERILREPRGDKRTWLYVLPILAIGFAAAFLLWFLRRQRQFVPLQSAGDHAIVMDEDFDW